MASKSLPEKMAKHVASELHEWAESQRLSRLAPKMSQTDIAEWLGLDATFQSRVSSWLQGEAIGVDALLLLSRGMGRTINELLGPTAPQIVAPEDDAVISLVQAAADLIAEMAASQVSDQRVLNKWGEMKARLAKLPPRYAPRLVDRKVIEEARRQKRLVAPERAAAKVSRPAKRKAAGQ